MSLFSFRSEVDRASGVITALGEVTETQGQFGDGDIKDMGNIDEEEDKRRRKRRTCGEMGEKLLLVDHDDIAKMNKKTCTYAYIHTYIHIIL